MLDECELSQTAMRDKTVLISYLPVHPQQLAKCGEIIPDNTILFGDNIKLAAQVHNLGYWMDPSLKNHIQYQQDSTVIIPALKRHHKDMSLLGT